MASKIDSSHGMEDWFDRAREHASLSVARIPFVESTQWALKDGVLAHTSGRFFQVAGISYERRGRSHSQPIIIQRETGILGFCLRDHELLAYAKVEPGNIGAVQLAPTCQATASNLDRVHGGELPSFAPWFRSANAVFAHDSLQSEQGTRFWGKRNRNVLLISGAPQAAYPTHAWLATDAILEWTKCDFMINTDARSVLVCSPWELLVDREPFARYAGAFSTELRGSFESVGTQKDPAAVQAMVVSRRASLSRPSQVPLDALEHWRLTDTGVVPLLGRPFEVIQIRVHVRGRETPSWDQPIISSAGEGYAELVCGRIGGLLHFLFVLQAEPGLHNLVELGPSLVVEPGGPAPAETYASHAGASVLAQCRQSDEGGRFFRDISTYRLVDAGDAFAPPDDGCWLTLAQVRTLLSEGGWFTNEARSALSLLLAWL